MKRLVLSLAQGFGLGRIRVAPGTFGSLAGMLWFILLASLSSAPLFAAGAVLAISVSVWLTGDAERILQSKDPSSVVLDEIVAVPACFVSWMLIVWILKGHWPGPVLLRLRTMAGDIGSLRAFRFFDILKPWPVRQVSRFRADTASCSMISPPRLTSISALFWCIWPGRVGSFEAPQPDEGIDGLVDSPPYCLAW